VPNFFVPLTDPPEDAEAVYAAFVRSHSIAIPPNAGRLFQITFTDRGSILVAEVGREIRGFRENVGLVLGIVESGSLVTIHTERRNGLTTEAILVSSDKISSRRYFDDSPPRA
jgi:hypothetical protein